MYGDKLEFFTSPPPVAFAIPFRPARLAMSRCLSKPRTRGTFTTDTELRREHGETRPSLPSQAWLSPQQRSAPFVHGSLFQLDNTPYIYRSDKHVWGKVRIFCIAPPSRFRDCLHTSVSHHVTLPLKPRARSTFTTDAMLRREHGGTRPTPPSRAWLPPQQRSAPFTHGSLSQLTTLPTYIDLTNMYGERSGFFLKISTSKIF